MPKVGRADGKCWRKAHHFLPCLMCAVTDDLAMLEVVVLWLLLRKRAPKPQGERARKGRKIEREILREIE